MSDELNKRLQEELHNVDLDSHYMVEQVLQASEAGRTEKVRAADGGIFIRKYLEREFVTGNEYASFFGMGDAPFPRIIALYELADAQVVIMEYLDGPTAQEYVEQHGKLEPADAVRVALGICSAAQILHTMEPGPIIHRDIKPSNVIVQDGAVKLIDFGIARRYKANERHDTEYRGTRGYAAPEQFGYSQTDARTDIHAIGATLYFLLTAEHFDASCRGALESSTEIPADLARIILRCTEFAPGARYQDVAELMAALRAADLSKPADSKQEEPAVPAATAAAPTAKSSASVVAPVPSAGTPQGILQLPVAQPLEPAPVSTATSATKKPTGSFRNWHESKVYRAPRRILIILINILFWPTFLYGFYMPFDTEYRWLFHYGTMAVLLNAFSFWVIDLLLVLPAYLLFTNPFKVLDRIKFFSRNRMRRVVFVMAAVFIATALLTSACDSLQSNAVKAEKTRRTNAQQSQQTKQ